MSSQIIVYIALSEEDVTYAAANTTKGDYIITDIHCPDHAGQTIAPLITVEEEGRLTKEVSQWYKDTIHDNRLSQDLYGYVNNFYECSVLPLVTYIRAIDYVINQTKNDCLGNPG